MIDYTNQENMELTPVQIDIDVTESFRESLSLRNYELLSLDRLSNYTGVYNRYIRIELINVNVDRIPYNFFANCTFMEHLNLSKNQISSLDGNVFLFNKNLRYIDLSNNQLGIIDLSIFSHLRYLKSIFFQNNLITQIDNQFSNENTHLKYVYLSENKIYRLDSQMSNRKVNLLKLDLCKNRIEFISEEFFQGLKCDYIDLTENPLFDFIYSKNIDENIKYFRVDHDYYENNYENFLMNLFDRKQPSKTVYGLDKGSKRYYYYFVINDLYKCEKIMRRLFYSESNFVCAKFEEIFEQYKLGNKTILDLLIQQENFGLTDFKQFKKKIDSFLKDHSVENVEMKFKCSLSFLALCERNDIELVEKFFPINAMYRFCKNFETYNLEKFVNSVEYKSVMVYFVTDSSFLLNIDYEKCLKIAYDKKNIKLIFYIFLLIKYTLINSKFDQGNDSVDYFKSHKNSFRLDKILILFRDEPSVSDFFFQFLFNEKMVKKFESTKGIVSRTNHSLYESCKQELLTGLSLVRRENLLKNELIQKIYKQLWSGVPRFMYFTNMLLYILFLIFYTIYIEKHDGSNRSQDRSPFKIITLILVIFFLFSEIAEMITYFRSHKILIYFTSFLNLTELSNYILCITALTIEINVVKSGLLSVTIIFSYFILIFRCDKIKKLGIFITLIGNIIKKSMALFFIITICLIGFLLAFRTMNKVPNANGEINSIKRFEYDFIKILIMGIGSLEIEDAAELDEQSGKTATNFILYVAFVILVPILMINILIGISIDELQKMINDSKYENMLTIIDYMINLRKN